MRILLCSATEMEIRPTIDWLQQHPLDVEVLITGVGLMAATHSLTRAVSRQRPGLLLQAGIAGSLDPGLALGDVILVRSETVADEGVVEEGRFRSLFDLGFIQANAFPFVDGRLPNESDLYDQLAMKKRDAVTINEISTAPTRINYYRHELAAAVESMEGAALHYVGRQEGIPFLQLRAISNEVGERDKSKWAFGTAIAQVNQEVQRILQNLANA